jgi:serine/threonine protein phosphatase PrpC
VLLQDFGTTAVVCVYFPASRHILVANCGDSDAVVGRKLPKKSVSSSSSSSESSHDGGAGAAGEDGFSIEPHQITVSHNVASNKVEIQRICQSHGKKTKFANGYLSPNHKTYGFHSLAMTRALGYEPQHFTLSPLIPHPFSPSSESDTSSWASMASSTILTLRISPSLTMMSYSSLDQMDCGMLLRKMLFSPSLQQALRPRRAPN